jgi:uracil phosphoribosyltransferase
VKGVTIISHPLVQHNLTRLRDRRTGPQEFRRVLSEVATLMLYEATRSFAVTPVSVKTPLAHARGFRLRREVVLVPVLRAGLGMLDAFLSLVPAAEVGYFGLERDETTAVARSYYEKVPGDLASAAVFLLDPMLATGGSAAFALERLLELGARRLALLSIVSAPEGVARLEKAAPAVEIWTAALDRSLDDRKYIRPGLGDFGDRLFGT